MVPSFSVMSSCHLLLGRPLVLPSPWLPLCASLCLHVFKINYETFIKLPPPPPPPPPQPNPLQRLSKGTGKGTMGSSTKETETPTRQRHSVSSDSVSNQSSQGVSLHDTSCRTSDASSVFQSSLRTYKRSKDPL